MAGQVATSAPSVKPEGDLSELIRLLETNVKAIVRVTAVMTRLSERADEAEKRLTALEGDGNTDKVSAEEEAPESSERRSIGHTGRLALRSDGIALLEVTDDIAGIDLLDREVAQYVALSEAETSDALERADAGLADASAHAAWQIARARKGYPSHE